jgi:hypothetical protein
VSDAAAELVVNADHDLGGELVLTASEAGLWLRVKGPGPGVGNVVVQVRGPKHQLLTWLREYLGSMDVEETEAEGYLVALTLG